MPKTLDFFIQRTLRYLMIALLLGPTIANTAVNDNKNLDRFFSPFSDDSLWNSKPLNPKFSNYVIPLSNYNPNIHEGAWSVGVFLADESDGPIDIYGEDKKGILDPDSGKWEKSIRIDHWPSNANGATGGDGHADIVDISTGKIHSLFHLRKVGNIWRALTYGWTELEGRGWPDPAHFYQGVRATGVPPMAGVIRKHEACDATQPIKHALAMSLTFNALSLNDPYVFPATSADYVLPPNSGEIPEGALMMLPANFKVDNLDSVFLQRVIDALKTYGGYIVDRNEGTPFVIYVENGAGIESKCNWSSRRYVKYLDAIRANLRVVEGYDAFVDRNGRMFQPNKNLNLIAFREPWVLKFGKGSWKYSASGRQLEIESDSNGLTLVNNSGTILHKIKWATPKVGEQYAFKNTSCQDTKVSFLINSSQSSFRSGDLLPGEEVIFKWPGDKFYIAVQIKTGHDGRSCANATLHKVSD